MSAIGIDGQSYLSVSIGGKEVPLDKMRFQRWLTTSHILYHIPMGELVFVDPHDIISKHMTMADGTEIVIKAGRTRDKVYQYTYHLFNADSQKQDDGVLYKISFVDLWDKWRLGTNTGVLNMSSGEALQSIADACGLSYKGIATTADKQTWYPMAESNALFARRIARLGYMDDRSCMVMGVSLNGELRYENLAALDISMPLFEFVHGVQEGIWCTDWKARSNSGGANQSGGYATTQHSFAASGTADTQNKAKLTRISNSANLNVDSKAAAGAGKVMMNPIDAGNNHPNANAARYQNKRLMQLLSSSVSVLTPMDPDVDLLEPVWFNNFITDKQTGVLAKDEGSSGLFIIAGKAIHIGADLAYNERYQLIREGSDAENSTKVT